MMYLGAAFLHLCFLAVMLCFVLLVSGATLRELWRLYARDRLKLGAYVLVLETRNGRKVYPVRLRRTSIGRVRGNHIVLNHATVSRRHAEIRWKSGFLKVYDQGSTNGTRVNGKVVSNGGEVVNVGDVIRLGKNGVAMRLSVAGSSEERFAEKALNETSVKEG